jgi:WD40 repeat protein
VNLSGMLEPERIRIPLKAKSAEEAIRELCELIGHSSGVGANELADAVLDREEWAGNLRLPGISFPHAASPLVGKIYIAVGRFEKDARWTGYSSETVRHVFVAIGSENLPTARVISRLRLLLDSTAAREQLFKCEDADELYQFLTRMGLDFQTPDGFQLQAVVSPDQDEVGAFGWSRDGLLASVGGSTNKSVKIWNKAGAEMNRLNGHQAQIYCVAWSPDGTRIATGSEDRSIRIWSARPPFEYLHQIPTNDPIHDVAWSPDGQYVLAGGHLDGVNLWPVNREKRGERKALEWGERMGPSLQVDWPRDSRGFAAVGGKRSQALIYWDAETLRPLHSEDLSVHGTIYAMCGSPGGEVIAVGLRSGSVLLYDTRNWNPSNLKAHEEEVTSVAFSPDARLLATKSRDGRVRVWRTRDLRKMAEFLDPASDLAPQAPVAFSNSGKLFASLGGVGDSIRIWALEAGSLKEGFDVLLSYSEPDRPAVSAIKAALAKYGIRAWFDVDDARPGEDWMAEVGRAINKIEVAAFFIGPGGIGDSQMKELYALLQRPGLRNKVIPVVLPGVHGEPPLPPFLQGHVRVDYRKRDANPEKSLVWGITEKPLPPD